MKAVWSLWTKPLRENRQSIWVSNKHHLLSWILSVETAKKHYPETALFTDSEGARMLVDELGLEFTQVFTELDALENSDPRLWALGKVYTYRTQTEPFIHIDSDVFLWKPLPSEMVSAPLLAQNPEYFVVGNSCYDPEGMETAISHINGWLPEEWMWQRSCGLLQTAYNCGIFGGHAVDFIRYYASLAIEFVEHLSNQLAWLILHPDSERNILFEQYLLGCCVRYHQHQTKSPYKDIDVKCLFSSLDDAFIPDNAARVGFTHLIADAKKNRKIAEHLEHRVKKDYPKYYYSVINSF
ncbi:hypothetical protein RIVM261_000010 [Rivularia sp. IAM M-261]|nr:hypothetical protein CAL7716_052590 [Calothrix sp. PCC 7716]GJD15045.1 hypothetical protein RIVM261_000010 [Rivularia sp. IAM M-261]